jgi:6-hydroxynicotinate 3-monooxygenase
VQVYEQASRFARIGAGIQMMPNSMKVLRPIGIEERVRASSFEPYSHLNRQWDTGEVMRELPMPESLFGAPYLCMHRGDLHEALLSVLPDEIISRGKKLVGLDERGSRATLTFEDGDTAEADAVVGADGVHSIVRDIMIGPDAPIHKGRIAYRAVFPSALMGDRDVGNRYEAHRKPRTSRIQAISSANTWMKGGNDDTSWLYGYEAWNVPLNEPALNSAS